MEPSPRLVLFALAALLAGCAALPPAAPPAAPVEAPPDAPPDAGGAAPRYRNFPADTLHELLLAEFAGMRGQVEPALEIYAIQAHETRDPGVIRRAIQIARHLRRHDVVLDLAELWVAVDPEEPDARRLLAFHLAAAGRVVEAFPHAEFLRAHGDPAYLRSLAIFAADAPRREQERLLALYRALLERHPEDPGALLGAAELLRLLARPREALALAARAVARAPDDEGGQLLHAQLLYELGRKGRALRALRRALEVIPDSKPLRLQYARYLADRDLAASREQMRILAEQDPEDPDVLFSLALVERELGDADAARRILEQLAAGGPRAADAHFLLGRMEEDAGRPGEAIYHYRQVTSGANLLAAALRAASLYAEHRNLAAARAYLGELRAIYPALRESLYQIEAEILSRHGRPDEARALLGRALEEFPDSPELRYARAIAAALAEDLPAAEADLRWILERRPDDANALNALGYTLLELAPQRREEAVALIERAYALDPDNPAIVDSLGWARFLQGRAEEAAELLRRAYEALPEAEVAAHLGEVLWVLEQRQEALAVWRRALAEDPGDRTLRRTLERLAPGLLEEAPSQ